MAILAYVPVQRLRCCFEPKPFAFGGQGVDGVQHMIWVRLLCPTLR